MEPIRRFLRDFLVRGHDAGSVLSHAFDLHRWWRFPSPHHVERDQLSAYSRRKCPAGYV
ncbi:hypothetical protein [Streptomyces sp. NPDC002845]